ncbi:MAG: VWA domain-containing protein [Deltaproteobacteria bacterium]|nr:VWA domain-containing protein [Deltaproteobacteria bacterium]
MGFATPLMLLGLLAAAVPVAAHLMRRRDLPRVELPTVALLSRAIARSRRRVHVVDLLLLAARILLIVALAVAVADPFIEVRLAYGDGQAASVAIVIDDSMSMERPLAAGGAEGTGGRDEPLAALARAEAQDAIDALPEGSEVSVILAGSPFRLLVPRTDDLAIAIQALDERGGPSARATDLPGAVARAIRELAGAGVEARRLLVFTDGAAHAHIDDVRWPEGGISVEVRRYEGRPDNRAIIAAEVALDPTTPGQVSIAVHTRAHGDFPETRVRLLQGDAEIDARSVDLTTGSSRVTLHGPLAVDGDPSARLVLDRDEGDAVAIDDERAVLLRRSAAVRVLLVDGDPHPSRDRDEVGYLARALDLAPEDHGVLSYRVVDPDTAEALDLAAWDVVVLANVRVPSSQATTRLRRFVEDGGGLLIAGGDRVETGPYAARLGELLPARPTAIAASPGLSLASPIPSDAARATALGLRVSNLEGTTATRRWVLDAPPTGAQVAVAFTDGSPALVLGEVGSGRTAMLALTLDAAWSDLPYQPGFLPLMVELLEHLAPDGERPRGAIVPGTVLELATPPGADAMVIVGPDGSRHEYDERGPFTFEQTAAPGAYRVLAAARGGALSDIGPSAFVVAPPSAESDLTPGDPDEDPSRVGTQRADGDTVTKRGIAPWLFLLAGILAVVEGWLRMRRRAWAAS